MNEIFEARGVQYNLRNKIYSWHCKSQNNFSLHRNCEIFGSKAMANTTSQYCLAVVTIGNC